MAREDGAVKAQRILAMLQEFDRQPVAVSDLAERFNTTPETIRSELETARQCGVPDYDEAGTLINIFFDDDMVTIASPGVFSETPRLVGAEGLAVLAAAQTMQYLRPDDGELASAADKLEDALDAGGRVQVSVQIDEHLPQLLEAEASQVRIRGHYWSKNTNTVRERLLEPLHVFWATGSWYARCREVDSGMIKQFRVDGFKSVEVTDETFDPGDFDDRPTAFSAPADVVTACVWFPAAAAWVRTDIDVRIRRQDDNGLEAELAAVGTVWLEGLLLRTGGRVLEPPDLVGLGVDAASRTLQQYE